jgi:hypothetical protein
MFFAPYLGPVATKSLLGIGNFRGHFRRVRADMTIDHFEYSFTALWRGSSFSPRRRQRSKIFSFLLAAIAGHQTSKGVALKVRSAINNATDKDRNCDTLFLRAESLWVVLWTFLPFLHTILRTSPT